MATNPFAQLDAIRSASVGGRRITDCYRLMFRKELWVKAYSKLAPNPGNLTVGTESQTIDGFSLHVIDSLVEQLQEGTFRFTPVRRTYIPKPDGRKRPLGVPNFKDKLVQEVMRMILDNIYEPIFSENSHGFRPGRSCHTALSQIKHTWKGLVWCIEGDIKGFFDNIDHQILIATLKHKIDDRRFMLLIHNALKCGYVEDWKYFATFSGTPQGGVISPILANIYLHELDTFIEDEQQTYNRGAVRKRNKEYKRVESQIRQTRKKIDVGDENAKSKEWEGRYQLVQQIGALRKSQRHISSIDPMDPAYRRMRFVRYADDFVIGIAGPKVDAEILKAKVERFLDKTLHLELSQEKTLITHLEKKVRFLGYDFSKWNQQRVVRVNYHPYTHPLIKRTLSGAIKLEIPRQKMSNYATKQGYGSLDALQKSIHRAKLLNNSDLEILITYNAELRGIANYYQLANNYHHLDPLFHLATYSFLKTTANKHRSSVHKMAVQYGRHLQGEFCVPFRDKRDGLRLRKLVKLRHLPKGRKVKPEIDVIPNTLKYSGETELEARLMANTCEACEKTTGTMEVHHVRKLKDVRSKRDKTWLDRVMITRKRKTLVLCYECHHLHHEQQVPIEQLESRVK